MDPQSACALLGFDARPTREQLEAAYGERRLAIEQRLESAPTEALGRKYRTALEELEAARGAIVAAIEAQANGPASADLPAAQPSYTRYVPGVESASESRGMLRMQPGRVLASRYEVREQVGGGGMGAVYRAFDRNRGEEIAVKVLLPHLLRNPAARERFVAEAKIASALSHPNIVNVYDVQRDGELDLLTMELLQGGTLRQLMRRRSEARQTFSVEEALGVALAIGAALTYAHRRTLHRDVKPENVWVEEDGTYKLMDFGLARLMSESNLTATRATMGSAYYMAPEQIKSAKTIDARADQYSLAVLLYEMLAGELPTGRARSLSELRKDVARPFSAAVDKALETDPTRRFADVAQFVEALKIKGSPLDRLKQRNVAIAAGAVLALALAIVIAPSLMALLPDRAAAGQARAQAIQTQGMVHTLLERIETEERALEEALRRAHGDVDRQESALRSARTASERREAEARLAEVRQALAAETGVRDLAVQQIFKSRELVSVRGDVALGETALEDGDYAVAAAALGAARGKLEALLDLPVAAREAYAARARSAVAIERLESLARAEKRDVGNSVQALRGRLAQADAALGAGRARDAAGTYVAVAREAGATFNTLIDELIASYGELAQRAMNANELRSAQTAIDRAKALRAMKVPTA